MLRHITILAVLALTQITGWGVVGILPVLASPIAADLGTGLPTAFLGTGVMFVALRMTAPAIGRAFRAHGAKRVMALGAAAIGGGLAMLSVAGSVAVYLTAWAVIGVAGAMFLTTAAYVYLAEIAEERARSLIGTLMLVTGLAGSVFWPLTAVLDHAVGWRPTVQIYAATMLALVLPLVLLALPATEASPTPAADATDAAPSARRGPVFWLLVGAIALNGFVTFGMEAIGIELFRALGADQAFAIAVASFLGVLKVCGRLIDLVGGKRWDALSTGLVAAAMIPAGLSILLVFGASAGAILACLVLFGIGSGAFAVARATMPLLFYRKAEYAAAMSAIALPMNLTNAAAAPILSALLTGPGAGATLTTLVLCSALALGLLLRLGRSRALMAAS